MTDVQAWMAYRAKEDEQFYERFGKPLEKEHTGEYVAITSDGRTIIGTDDVPVLKQAIDTFGSGNFALTRVGRSTFGQWLSLHQ
ncbi:MAG: hypothetical protein EXR50_08020 [Dehalococcoidia bacterium]|nr:hypothetical protein [Dehalococcoidia bacterium]